MERNDKPYNHKQPKEIENQAIELIKGSSDQTFLRCNALNKPN